MQYGACNIALPVDLDTSSEPFAISRFPFSLAHTFTVDLDLFNAQAPGDCTPPTWRIRTIEVGTSPTPGEGLFYRFLRPLGAPDVSQLEGIFTSAPSTVSNVRWECQG